MDIHSRLYHRPLLTFQPSFQLSEIEEFILTKVIIIQTNLRTLNIYTKKSKTFTVSILVLIFFKE